MTTPTSTSTQSTTAINTNDIANGQPGTPVDPNLDPSSSITTTTTSISSETKLSLVLPSTQTLLAIPAQYTALRAFLDRGVDGAGELEKYFTSNPSDRGSRKVGGATGEVSDDNKQKVENGVERKEQVDVGQRIRAIRRTLDTRNFGTPPSVSQGTQSARPEVEDTVAGDEVVDGDAAGYGERKGARAENLRRVGEVLGRWDAFVSHLFALLLFRLFSSPLFVVLGSRLLFASGRHHPLPFGISVILSGRHRVRSDGVLLSRYQKNQRLLNRGSNGRLRSSLKIASDSAQVD
jgi:hypothetical protein